MRLRTSTIIKYVFILFIMMPSMNRAQQIDYFPTQKSTVNDVDYKFALTVLDETYTGVKRDKGVFNYADYWNLAIAFSSLDADVELVREYFFKSKELDHEKFSVIFLTQGDIKRWQGYLSLKEYEEIKKACLLKIKSSNNNDSNPLTSDMSLVDLMSKISRDDQKYRFLSNKFPEKQKILDDINLKLIDSLYKKHNKYIGKTLVGKNLSQVMWSVIQHSNLISMEKYLPIVFDAVCDKELEPTTLKLLIDRVYAIKYNYQIFGSQGGVELAPNNIIKQVKLKYKFLNN